VQPGGDPPPFFSYRSQRAPFEQTPCHLTRTTEATKRIISNNFRRSPIFSGQIKSRGPRYCPSIEDKFFRFSDKSTHHIFLEPEGNGTSEVYPNGFSTALPEEVQFEAIRTVIGLEEVRITRPGYAVEYDFCPACQIERTLQTRRVRGLFFAGQINGTSGYEEAAAQGIIAGINAVLSIENQPLFVLDRSQAYIGVMIDDLITRSTTEPYRMFTSRAEYRLALREDNVRDRLAGFAHQYGLISNEDFDTFDTIRLLTDKQIQQLEETRVDVGDLGDLGDKFAKRERLTLADMARHPGITISDLLPLIARFDGRFTQDREVLSRAAIRIKYRGYVEKQQREIDKFRRQEQETIPPDFPFRTVAGLRSEAREKFLRYQPVSLGQAGRIEGITMGDLAVLSVNLMRFKTKAE
jgi:tRNA uridine 5-carboxymethylaminomethyl modification enzyme